MFGRALRGHRNLPVDPGHNDRPSRRLGAFRPLEGTAPKHRHSLQWKRCPKMRSDRGTSSPEGFNGRGRIQRWTSGVLVGSVRGDRVDWGGVMKIFDANWAFRYHGVLPPTLKQGSSVTA